MVRRGRRDVDLMADIDGLPANDALDSRGRHVFDYWVAKRGARKMPARADLEPGDIPGHLPDIGLVDVLPDEPYFRYRLLGTRQVAASHGVCGQHHADEERFAISLRPRQ